MKQNTKSDIRVIRTDSVKRTASDLKNNEIMDRETELTAFERLKGGDMNAMEEILKANSRFVYSTVLSYGIYDDMITDMYCAGMEGMMEAAQTFDPTRGVKFITYAVHYINKHIRERAAEYDNVRINSMVRRIRNSANAFSNRFFVCNGRYPTIEEIMDNLNRKYNTKVPSDYLHDNRCISIDIDADDTEAGTSVSRYESLTSTTNGFEIVMADEKRRHDINVLLSKLPEKDEYIIRLLYGIGTDREHSVMEVSMKTGIGEAAVRASIRRSIERMKKNIATA